MRCKHENVRDLRCVSADVPYVCRRCMTCGTYFSLGPANDAAPNVAMEIEAARIGASR